MSIAQLDLPELDEPLQASGRCEAGGCTCPCWPELVVLVPSTGVMRELCREHAGLFMLGAASEARATRVLVRRLGEAES